jgi:hypothetical protein
MKKSNWKTSALGALTIIIALATGAKEFLATNSLPDIGLIFSSVLAGWGLIAAKDADSRI